MKRISDLFGKYIRSSTLKREKEEQNKQKRRIQSALDNLTNKYFESIEGSKPIGRINLFYDAYKAVEKNEQDFCEVLSKLLNNYGKKEMLATIAFFWENENFNIENLKELVEIYDEQVGLIEDMDYFVIMINYTRFWQFLLDEYNHIIGDLDITTFEKLAYKISESPYLTSIFKKNLKDILDECWMIGFPFEEFEGQEMSCKKKERALFFQPVLKILCDCFPDLQSDILGHAYNTFLEKSDENNVEICTLLEAIADFEEATKSRLFTSDKAFELYVKEGAKEIPWARNILKDIRIIFYALFPTDDISGVIWVLKNRFHVDEDVLNEHTFDLACKIFEDKDIVITVDIEEIIKTSEGYKLFPYYFVEMMKEYSFADALEVAEKYELYLKGII